MHKKIKIKKEKIKITIQNSKIILAVGLFVLWGLVFNGFVTAEEKEFKKSCRSCHSELLDKWDMSEVKHFPYREEKCESCHAAEHKKFTAESGKPCLICHDLNSEKIKKAHFSVDLGGVNCFNCHYTHAADKKGLLKESTHEPFASGMCDVCHNIGAEGKIEVKGQTKKICLVCHSSLVAKEDTIKHSGYDMLECVDCHNPHTSGEKWLLKKKITQICFDCHGKEEAVKHPYDVVPSQKINLDKNSEIWLTYDKQISCISCHNPHSAKIPFLLRESLDEGKLCNLCHSKE